MPKLKIAVLKDVPTIPNGGAVENGALLSATELEKHSYFINSPSDEIPVQAASDQTKEDYDGKDRTYWPPKRSNTLDDEAPGSIYGSDGEELMSETEWGRELVSMSVFTLP